MASAEPDIPLAPHRRSPPAVLVANSLVDLLRLVVDLTTKRESGL